MPRDSAANHRPERLAGDHLQTLLHEKSVPMDTFKWIVSSLLAALVFAVGWFLDGIHTELRDVRKEVMGIRVDAAVATSKLDALIAEFRRRDPR